MYILYHTFLYLSIPLKNIFVNFLFFLLAVRLERTSSLCRLNRRHQPQMGEPDSNGWSGISGDSPRPTHTICVLYSYYTTLYVVCQGFYIFWRVEHRVTLHPLPLTLILYHNSYDLSILFWKFFCKLFVNRRRPGGAGSQKIHKKTFKKGLTNGSIYGII